MASSGISATHILTVMLVAMLCFMTKTMAQGAVAPSPALETGAGFASSVSGALFCSSILASLLALMWEVNENSISTSFWDWDSLRRFEICREGGGSIVWMEMHVNVYIFVLKVGGFWIFSIVYKFRTVYHLRTVLYVGCVFCFYMWDLQLLIFT